MQHQCKASHKYLLLLSTAFVGVFPFKQIIAMLSFSYGYKIICNLFMIIPAAFMVSKLKRAENLDVYDRGVKFNPFSSK